MKYRKRPVTIEAFQWSQGVPFPPGFEGLSERSALLPYTRKLKILTLEGWIAACEGDWIIKGIAGEFYPCKPEFFEATYEAIP